METHRIKVGNTRTPVGVTLKQKNTSGTLTVVDLSGLTVKFSMVNSSGATVVAETTTGVTVNDATNGQVQYDFQTANVTAAGTYYGQFNVYTGAEYDSFPVEPRTFRILIGAAE